MATGIGRVVCFDDTGTMPAGPMYGGYRCACGAWVTNGWDHRCLVSKAFSTNVRQCERCGQWEFGGVHHACPSPACQHCYCIDVPPSGERARPHARCCQCGTVRLGKAVDG